MSKQEYKGYWYIPSNPNKVIAGILTLAPKSGVTLELLGCFEDFNVEVIKGKILNQEIIYGNTAEGEKITLFQSVYSGSKCNTDAKFPLVCYSSLFMIIGKHSLGLDEKCRYSATIKIPALSLWCYPNALSRDSKIENGIAKQNSISYNPQYNDESNIICSVQVNENTTFILRKNVIDDSSYYMLSPVLEQYTFLEIKKTAETTIKELLSDILLFEQFLSLATLSIVISSEIILFEEDFFDDLWGTKVPCPIEVFCRLSNRIENIKQYGKEPHKYLFRYDSIKDIFPDIIKKWYADAPTISPIRDYLIKCLEKKRAFDQLDFLIVIQAIEGFCRRFRNHTYKKQNNLPKEAYKKLFEMLEGLEGEFINIDFLINNKINKDGVVDTRTYLSHFMNKNSLPNVIEGIKLYKETQKLKVLLLCCTLWLLGFDKCKMNDLINKSDSDLFFLDYLEDNK